MSKLQRFSFIPGRDSGGAAIVHAQKTPTGGYVYAHIAEEAIESLEEDLEAAKQQVEYLESEGYIGAQCVPFFRWWHNQPGSNTQQGFEKWWREVQFPGKAVEPDKPQIVE